jgi:hypothetical protein
LEKTRCTRTLLPATHVSAPVLCTPYPPTREIQISKIFLPVHIKSIPVPAEKKTKTEKKNKKHKQKKQKHKKNTRVPVHVPETGTGMKRIRYSFKKKIVYP